MITLDELPIFPAWLQILNKVLSGMNKITLESKLSTKSVHSGFTDILQNSVNDSYFSVLHSPDDLSRVRPLSYF